MNTLFKKLVVVLLAASFAVMSFGCYGSFNLTKKVYNWNGSMEGKWVKEVVFLVLSIVPVYDVAVVVDVLILNSVEFWTGSNPVSAITTDDGTTVAFNQEKKETTVSYHGKEFIVSRDNGTATVKDGSGAVLASVVTAPDGAMNIVAPDGTVLASYTASDVNAMLAQQ